MFNNWHHYQQSEQWPVSSDGQQFTPTSTKRTIISKQLWSIIRTNINKQRITSKQWWTIIPPISINQTNTSKQWWPTIHTSINKANKHLQTVMVNNSTNINKANNHLQTVMVNNSHQHRQSEQSPLGSDCHQFTPISTMRTNISKQWWSTIPPISTKRTIISKQWWSTIHTNINKANNYLYTVMVNNSHQYQQSE